jgi:cis-3-alkyl-4-acyloxetan-2-one decarboxylase
MPIARVAGPRRRPKYAATRDLLHSHDMSADRQPAPLLPPWLAALVPFERSVVEVDGRLMHVMETGRGSKTVVMLHGNPTWGFLYRKIALILQREDLRLVMPDLVGLGFSDHPTDPQAHTLDNHQGWVAGLLRALEIREAVFVGQDWGGAIGIGAFERAGVELSGLVVLNTVLGPPRPGFHPTSFHRLARLPVISDLLFRRLSFPQSALALAQGDKLSIRGDVARAYRYPLRASAGNAAPLALARMVPDSVEHPSVEALRRVGAIVDSYRGPAEIVWGRRDPVLGRLLGRVRRALPKARVTETDAGHFLQEEVPVEIAEAILRVASSHRPPRG